MVDKSGSPFSGLDKALLRSTQPQPAAKAVDSTEEPPKKAPRRATPKKVDQQSSLSNNDASTAASLLACYQPDMSDIVHAIRKTVKLAGREVSFVRLSPEEKAQLADIVYTYKRQGKKTSENEINRIAVNFILRDYKANGENSILAKVIEALLA